MDLRTCFRGTLLSLEEAMKTGMQKWGLKAEKCSGARNTAFCSMIRIYVNDLSTE